MLRESAGPKSIAAVRLVAEEESPQSLDGERKTVTALFADIIRHSQAGKRVDMGTVDVGSFSPWEFAARAGFEKAQCTAGACRFSCRCPEVNPLKRPPRRNRGTSSGLRLRLWRTARRRPPMYRG